jgi:hypothetical protein
MTKAESQMTKVLCIFFLPHSFVIGLSAFVIPHPLTVQSSATVIGRTPTAVGRPPADPAQWPG